MSLGQLAGRSVFCFFFFAEYPPWRERAGGRGAKANILKSEIMGEGGRNGNRFGGQAGSRSERKGGKAGSFPCSNEKMALLSLGGRSGWSRAG